MISGCINSMRADACGDCRRRDACASLMRLFGIAASGAPPASRTARAPRNADHPFAALLGFVAGTVESWTRERATIRAREQGRDAPDSGQARGPLCRAVEAAVEPLLPNGPVRIGGVARALGLSRQTLYRRLRAEGTTFERLLDGVRRRLALELVRDPGVAVKDAAYRLGFSDPAAFSRAFKRWTGASPQAMRNGAAAAAPLSPAASRTPSRSGSGTGLRSAP